ncbi:prepilin peptidase [Pajaroellobacter abortibovis]|uniref:Prepilin leader peptidase/N-methyltransferase n=1 Tax=Pajaroellobacter abortibovis TaxID=1882918 RepID=A0A1L6MUX9_9BACT|nr:A24 family peptidase [Pajaroellobacter abortibovis]APR99324.1 hypothetical protein BCY86_00510 [Pajaroellobacter abortibovis]
MTWIVRITAILFGFVWGSFIHLVIYRLPRGLSIVRPGSSCLACRRLLAPYEYIPVLSYIGLRGRASCCGVQIGLRSFLVEWIGGGLSLALVETLFLPSFEERGVVLALALFLIHFFMALFLIGAALIDAEWMILPDSITWVTGGLALLTYPWRGFTFVQSWGGALFGFMMIYIPFVALYQRLRGRPGMGMGDAKISAVLGAWLGWQGALFALLTGSLQGVLAAGLLYLIAGRVDEPVAVQEERRKWLEAAAAGDSEAQEILATDPLAREPLQGFRHVRIPFGPFLILGGLEYLFFVLFPDRL